MNKNFKFYTAIWAIMLGLFNVVAFLVRPSIAQLAINFNSKFFVMWGVEILAFVINLCCAKIAFQETNSKKVLYHIPLVKMSFTSLILVMVFGSALMLISNVQTWFSAVVCLVIVLVQSISLVNAKWAADAIEITEQKIQAKTNFIRMITADAETLITYAKTDEAKSQCKKVYEALRYSDPMSSEELFVIEAEIQQKFMSFSEKIKSGEDSSLSEELVSLIKDRNRKCKAIK